MDSIPLPEAPQGRCPLGPGSGDTPFFAPAGLKGSNEVPQTPHCYYPTIAF